MAAHAYLLLGLAFTALALVAAVPLFCAGARRVVRNPASCQPAATAATPRRSRKEAPQLAQQQHGQLSTYQGAVHAGRHTPSEALPEAPPATRVCSTLPPARGPAEGDSLAMRVTSPRCSATAARPCSNKPSCQDPAPCDEAIHAQQATADWQLPQHDVAPLELIAAKHKSSATAASPTASPRISRGFEPAPCDQPHPGRRHVQPPSPGPPPSPPLYEVEEPCSPTSSAGDRQTTASMPMLPSRLAIGLQTGKEHCDAFDTNSEGLGRNLSSLHCPSLSSIDTLHQSLTPLKPKATAARRFLSTLSIGSDATTLTSLSLPRPGKVQRSMHRAASKAAAAVSGVFDGAKAAAAAALAKMGHKGSAEEASQASLPRGASQTFPGGAAAPRVMVSCKDGDKRTSVFRANKVLPTPVYYAMVHPKPIPAAAAAGAGKAAAGAPAKPAPTGLPAALPLPQPCKLPASMPTAAKERQLTAADRHTADIVQNSAAAFATPARSVDCESLTVTSSPIADPGYKRRQAAQQLEPLRLHDSPVLGEVERLGVNAARSNAAAASVNTAANAAAPAQTTSANPSDEQPPLRLFELPWQQLDICAEQLLTAAAVPVTSAPSAAPLGVDPATTNTLAGLWPPSAATSAADAAFYPPGAYKRVWQTSGTCEGEQAPPHRLTATGISLWTDADQAGVWGPPDAGDKAAAWGWGQEQEHGSSTPATPQSVQLMLPDDLYSPDGLPGSDEMQAWAEQDVMQQQQQQQQQRQLLDEQLLMQLLLQREDWATGSTRDAVSCTNGVAVTDEQLQALLAQLSAVPTDLLQQQQQTELLLGLQQSQATAQTQAMQGGLYSQFEPPQPVTTQHTWPMQPTAMPIHLPATASLMAACASQQPCTPQGYLPPCPLSPRPPGKAALKGLAKHRGAREHPAVMLGSPDRCWDAVACRNALPGSPHHMMQAQHALGVAMPTGVPACYASSGVSAPHTTVAGLQVPILGQGLPHVPPQPLYLLPQGAAPGAMNYAHRPMRGSSSGVVLLPHGQVALVPCGGWVGPPGAWSRYETSLTASVVQVRHAGAPPVPAVPAVVAASTRALAATNISTNIASCTRSAKAAAAPRSTRS